MTSIINYEVQAYRNGGWKIESICDDREIAVFEAKRILQRPHNLAVRVMRESSRPGDSDSFVKMVYREAKGEVDAPPPPRRPAPARRAARVQADTAEWDYGEAGGEARGESVVVPVFMVLLFGLLILSGIAAILALRHYFGAI